MAKTPEFMHVRPMKVDVGRGPETAQITFRRGGRKWLLPEGGGKVPARGREGAFWKRRIAEGAVEKFVPKPPPKAKPATKSKD